MLSSLLILVLGPHLASCLCECGYSARLPEDNDTIVFMDVVETDFTHVTNIDANPDWTPQQFNVTAENGRGTYGKAFLPSDVRPKPVQILRGGVAAPVAAGLELTVGARLDDGAVPSAEVDTNRLDLHWGSFRAGMKLTGVNGTCAAFFWYYNNTQEIDIEFLSREFDRENNIFPVNLVVQSMASLDQGYDASRTGTFKRANLTFDPTMAFHEYRFDYLPGRVLFYADSVLVAQMDGTSMPSVGGHLILQHWSNGNVQWSGGPPDENAVLTVSYVKAYFNSTDGDRQASAESQCHDPAADGAVCVIPDVIAANASTGGSFFTDTGAQPGSEPNSGPGTGSGSTGNGGDEESAANDSSLHGALLLTTLMMVYYNGMATMCWGLMFAVFFGMY